MWQSHHPSPLEPINPKDFLKLCITDTLVLRESQIGHGFVLCPNIGDTKAVREKHVVGGALQRKKASLPNGIFVCYGLITGYSRTPVLEFFLMWGFNI